MYDFNKDLIYFIKRDGVTENPYKDITEDIYVLYEKVFLQEIPVQSFRVSIKLGTTSLIEVNRIEDIKSSNQYFVNYKQGIVYFHNSQNNKKMNLKYRGQGVLLYPASRIYIESENGAKDAVKTLKDLISEGGRALDAIEEVNLVIENANRALATMNTAIINSNNAINTINSKISEFSTNESARISQENERKSNETTRVSEEGKRATAEVSRKTEEGKRVTAENTRKTSESTRVSSETTRNTKETERNNAEDVRVSSENNRNTKEVERNNAETNRLNKEIERNNAETNRKESEVTRVNSETYRNSKEEERNQSEGVRKSSETERVNKENTRITNETSRNTKEADRVSNETKRITEESKRISNENTRIADENIRKTTETQRASSELVRESNEAIRLTSEDARISQELKRVKDEDVRKTQENERVESEIIRISQEEIRQEASRISIENINSARLQTENATSTALITIKEMNDVIVEAENLIDNTVYNNIYMSDETYNKNNIVSYNGSSYIAKIQTKGNLPTNENYWGLLAQRGLDGKGSIVTVNNLSPDLNGNVVITTEIIGAEKTVNKGLANGYAELDANGKIPLNQVPDTLKQQTYVVSNATERLALTNLMSGDKAFEKETGDSYIYDGIKWSVMADADWENVSLDWTNITNKPISSVLDIDLTVSKSHTHNNKDILDGFAFVGGKLQHNNKNIGNVDSVNGKTGAVTINANEVGAYSKAETYSKQEVNANLTSYSPVEVLNATPTTMDKNRILFIQKSIISEDTP